MQVNLAQSPVGGSMSAPAPNPAGTLMQSWLEKWSEWEIQAVVSVSFSLQVILFFFAGIRRYSISPVLKVFLWLVYLTADAVAIYAMGHMSASLSKTSTDKHQLVAFWAPFLLLHLGGQDTITAYALEDNELWVRHLLNMSVQVAGSGYVLHKYIIADRATIVSAAVLVSVAGFVKYGERIWALKRASKDYREPDDPLNLDLKTEEMLNRSEKFTTYANVVKTAHWSLYLVKPFVIDRNEEPLGPDSTISLLLAMEGKRLPHWRDESARGQYIEEVYRAIEVQLALMYDMLYTKAQVVHTWYGYLIRGISFGFCFGALVAFTGSKRDRYSTPDVVITFVLLGGACALEVASAFKVIGSTWTYRILHVSGWKRLANAILFARYHLLIVKDGRWSNSVGQFDFVSFCGGQKTRYTRRRWIRLPDWWNKARYIKHAKLSHALKEIVWGLHRDEKSGMVQIEDVAIRSGYWARRLTGFNQSQELDWSLRLEFHYCVFIWHIATSTFLSDPAVKSELVDNTDTGMAEWVNTLSDYMMYLLVQHSDIIPMNAAAHNLFQKTCDCFGGDWDLYSKKHIKDGIVDVPHHIILDFMDKNIRHEFIRDLCHDLTSGGWDDYPGTDVMVKASILVRTLLNMELELTHKLVIIGRAWTEMLSYAATNASGEFHARQLSSGGEFLTHMLLLTKYSSAMLVTEDTLREQLWADY